MKINELTAELQLLAEEPFDESRSVDVIKVGDGDREITRIAVAMTGTAEVIRQAAEFGANFLIVHEPLFYTHRDKEMPYELCFEKKALIEQSGLTVFRFHDYAHRAIPDLICEGQLAFSELRGHFEKGKYFAVNRFILDEPMTTIELAGVLEKKLRIEHLRIAGDRNNKVKAISCCFGTPGHVEEELLECDTVLTGEICEWSTGEYVRDLCQLGKPKSVIVMGHINSEKFGMKLLADKIRNLHSEIEIKYLDCGDVYSYTANK